jgi:hypothetical protein
MGYVYVADCDITTSAAITVTTTAAPVSATALPVKNVVLLCALSTNTASIFIGDETVTSSTGVELVAGTSTQFYVRNPARLYAIVASGTQNLRVAVM